MRLPVVPVEVGRSIEGEWSIAPKELLPILIAVVVWGRRWCGQRVECHCDNVAVVAVIINSIRAGQG